MKRRIEMFVVIFASVFLAEGYGQPVNQVVYVSLQQAPLLRVDAGSDMTLEPGGSVAIGEKVYITGGTPGYSHTWEDEEQNFYFESSPVVSAPGVYSLMVTDMENCTALDSLQVLQSNPVLQAVDPEKRIRVIYQAGEKMLNLSVYNADDLIWVSIFSVSGKQLLSEKIEGGTELRSHKVSLRSIPKGVVVLHIQIGKSHYTEKLIIQ